jgi:hypothetical protein
LNISEILLYNFPNLLRVSEPLDFEMISKIAKNEFDCILFEGSLNSVKDSNTQRQALLIKPKLLIRNPLSTVILEEEMHPEILNKFDKIIIYIENCFELNSMSSLHNNISEIYGKEIKHGVTIFGLSKQSRSFSNKTIDVILCINSSIETNEKTHQLL